MNGFELLATSYKKLASDDPIIQSKIKVFEFLSTCSDQDICNLVQSSAFNELIKAYFEVSLKDAGFDRNNIKKALNSLNSTLEGISAHDIRGCLNE